MFKRIDQAETLLSFSFEGRSVIGTEGDTVATALLAAGERVFRTTPVSGSGRGPFCMIGVCFDCFVEIDGIPNRQACLTLVAEGMAVRTQQGKTEAGI